jgi:hypothetical protein
MVNGRACTNKAHVNTLQNTNALGSGFPGRCLSTRLHVIPQTTMTDAAGFSETSVPEQYNINSTKPWQTHATDFSELFLRVHQNIRRHSRFTRVRGCALRSAALGSARPDHEGETLGSVFKGARGRNWTGNAHTHSGALCLLQTPGCHIGKR